MANISDQRADFKNKHLRHGKKGHFETRKVRHGRFVSQWRLLRNWEGLGKETEENPDRVRADKGTEPISPANSL